MANHKSSIKRIRSNNTKRLRNRYQHKSTRTVIKAIRKSSSKADASSLLPKVFSMLDKLVKRNIIHKNKSANQKSKLSKFVNAMS
ncbi:MAG: 30S ribosomal protein S20 [Flavobacteriales bacterium]|nr:30S ribosomal protein S20 [Flavobacteriales bacterium]